jgi:hypothetical protein
MRRGPVGSLDALRPRVAGAEMTATAHNVADTARGGRTQTYLVPGETHSTDGKREGIRRLERNTLFEREGNGREVS